MNAEDYKSIEELFNKMSESDKNKLSGFLLSHNEEFQTNPVETIRKGLEELLQQKRDEMYIDKKIDSNLESVPGNNRIY